MNRHSIYIVLGIIIVIISTPLAYELVKLVFKNTNLAREYVQILNGFIYSLMLTGTLLFVNGLAIYIKGKK